MQFGFWDTGLLFAANSLAGKSSVTDALIVTTAQYLPIALIAYCAWRVYQRRGTPLSQKIRIGVLSLVAGIVARYGIGTTIRHFFPRPRPFVTYPLHQLVPESGPGFPSGHALFFFAFSAALYGYDRRLGTLSFLVTLVICAARVTAGIHYPSDIIAGAILGTAIGMAAWAFATRTGLIRDTFRI